MRCTTTLALVLLLALAHAPALAGKAVALLIGNADYVHERRLRNPVNDAELLGSVLKNTLKFDDVRVERNLNVAAMDRAIAAFVERARGADTVVFYYSGHGMKKSAIDRRNFLLPVDARTGAADALNLDRQAVAAEAVRDRLKALGAMVTLLVLDACRDGPGGGRSGSKGLSRNGGGNQLLVAYATEEDQVAEDGAGSNSTYAAALAQALQRPEPLLAQLDWVADEVQRRVPGQTPTRDGNLRHNAYLVSPFGVVNASVEDQAWALCSAASEMRPCEDYLSTWPAGRYGVQARARLQQLRRLATVARQIIKDCDACPELVVIPEGSFTMGSPAGEAGRFDKEGPQRTVWVASFLLGRTEVTQGQWKEVMGSNPSRYKECGDDCAVENVSWYDAVEYVRKLSAKTGRQYRLPSESEWEYAARAGTTTPFHTGQTITRGQANIASGYPDAGRITTQVGRFAPNAWGLYDIHGNVSEWVQDVWHDSYSDAPSDGTAWMDGGSQAWRVVRGGSMVHTPQGVRLASRGRDMPDSGSLISIGFRVARTL